MLFQPREAKHRPFEDLEASCIPVFPKNFSVKMSKKGTIGREQVPMTPAFSLTDYKVQGKTFDQAVLDLRFEGKDSHKYYSSAYVEISRVRSWDGWIHFITASSIIGSRS